MPFSLLYKRKKAQVVLSYFANKRGLSISGGADGTSHTENQRAPDVTGRRLQGKEANQLNDCFRSMISQKANAKKPKSHDLGLI